MRSTKTHSAGNGELLLRHEQRSVMVGGREVRVTATQFRLLAALLNEPGRTFSRAELIDGCIGTVVVDRTIDVHIKELRRKLGPSGWNIETVRRAGYRYRAHG